jgi:hypothetical protein
MSPAALLLLGGMIVLMLLIVVIPDDLDLPDAAFHRGTSPVLIHAQATSAPAAARVSATFQLAVGPESFPSFSSQRVAALPATPNFLPIFLRAIRR